VTIIGPDKSESSEDSEEGSVKNLWSVRKNLWRNLRRNLRSLRMNLRRMLNMSGVDWHCLNGFKSDALQMINHATNTDTVAQPIILFFGFALAHIMSHDSSLKEKASAGGFFWRLLEASSAGATS